MPQDPPEPSQPPLATETHLDALKTLVELQRGESEESVKRSYFSAERTHAAWIRTALATMTFGIAINQLGLALDEQRVSFADLLHPQYSTQAVGAILIAFSVYIAISSGLSFWRFSRDYRRQHERPAHKTLWLPGISASALTVFGLILLILMLMES